jgi:transposase
MSYPKPRQRYTPEFKADAVRLVVEQDYSCAEVARRLGICSNNVVRWLKQHREQQQAAEQGALSPKELNAEIRRLRKENERLRMEREILKKAAAFFANESD